MSNLIDALIAKYNGDILAAKANIKVYQNNPVGIGDHGDIVGAFTTKTQRRERVYTGIDNA